VLLNYIILSCPVLWQKIPPSINKSSSSSMGNFKEIQCHTVLRQNYNLEHTSFSLPPQVSRSCILQPIFHFWWDSAYNQSIPSSVWINTIFQQKFQMLRIFSQKTLTKNHLALQVGGWCSGPAPRSSLKNKKC
jgi:hypothetical protein